MAIHCPNCKHGMSVKDVKPGRYKPKCSKCGVRFALTVYAEADKRPLVEPLPVDPAGATTPSAPSTPATSTVSDAKKTDPATRDAAATKVPMDATLPTPIPAEATIATKKIDATVVMDSNTIPSAPAVPAPSPSAGDTLAVPPPGIDQTVAVSGMATVVAADDRTKLSSQATVPSGSAPHGATRMASGATSGAALPAGVPGRIGGYKVLKELGRGAMGAVYLCKQLSLDREVALKTIQSQWAANPTFITRFTREAYAAAQLTHHNVVQIYDLGVDDGTNWFSMEYVRGESLDDMIKRAGRLAPATAVGFILQAARGLAFAHSHGMIHRDVKPANMMLNDQGVVKIADLGLVKVSAQDSGAEEAPTPVEASDGSLAAARSDVTMVNVAMGTPAYMAPEQSSNAAGVDHRADIYSLGCSLYVMLTGKPPFEGATAVEVITKHRTAPVIRPDLVLNDIPKTIADITLKMVAKQPDQRYQNLADVIRDLEGAIGGGTNGKPVPGEEQATVVNQQAARFHQAPLARLRGPVALAFLGGCVLLTLALLFMSWSLASAVVAMGFSASISYFIMSGLSTRSPLFERMRGVLALARWTDWLTWIGGGLVFLLALWLLGWIWAWIFAMVLGGALGVAFSFAVDRRLAEQRREPIQQVEALLRQWRVNGMDEPALQHFIALHSGDHWEEFFESLYGYEAKLAMRQQLSQSGAGGNRHRFRAWRDSIIRNLDRRLAADREQRDRRHLQQLEEQNLRAQGVDPQQAKQQAGRIAEALVGDAAQARIATARHTASSESPRILDPSAAAAEKRARIKRMLAEAKSGTPRKKEFRLSETALAPVAWALSGKVRFLLGCLLIAGCAMWAKQNEIVSGDSLRAMAKNASNNPSSANVQGLAQTFKLQTAEPLRVPVVGRFFDSWYPGIAGVMLIFLGLFRGWKMSIFALPAAACIVFGPLFAPRVIMLVAGLAIGAVALIFGRSRV